MVSGTTLSLLSELDQVILIRLLSSAVTTSVGGVTYYRYTAGGTTYWAKATGTTSPCSWTIYPDSGGSPNTGGTTFTGPRDCAATDPADTLLAYDGKIAAPTGFSSQYPLVGVVFYDFYVGTQGANPNKCNNIQTLASVGASYMMFFQEDLDGDGQFDPVQGNDIRGYIHFVGTNGKEVTIPAAINFRETTGAILQVIGVIFDPGLTASVALGGTSFNLLGDTIPGKSSCVGMKTRFASTSGWSDYPFIVGEDRDGNAAATNQLLQDLNGYLTAAGGTTSTIQLTQSMSQSNDANQIKLLYGSSGQREATQVSALACTAGPGVGDTSMLISDIMIRCSDDTDYSDTPEVSYTLDLSGPGRGNELVNDDNTLTATYDGLPVAYYYGTEQLSCSGQDCNKMYFNIAVNTKFLADKKLSCTLFYGATAVSAADNTTFTSDGKLSSPYGLYGAVLYDEVALTSGTPANAIPSCGTNTINEPGSSVYTAYIRGSAYGDITDADFDYSFNGSVVSDLAADPPPPTP